MEARFECEVLTPLFLAGADPRLGAELRPPSLRGALRYWFRALLGASTTMCSFREDELDVLKREETRVFGSTDRGSPIAVRVLMRGTAAVASFSRDRALRTKEGEFVPTGKDYLLWSMAESGRPENPARYRPARQYIQPGVRFEVSLRSQFDGGALEKAVAAFWLLVNLGAIGSRANRGAGSIQVIRGQGSVRPEVFTKCESIERLAGYLSEGLRRCLAAVGGPEAGWRTLDAPSEYDVLCPDGAEIWVVAETKDGWPSNMGALNGIGERLRDYRRHRSPVGRRDHDAVLEWLERNGEGPVISRAAFGLPLPFRYSQGGPGDVIQSTASSRRASPLKIKITRLATGRYVGVLTLFRSRFLPSEAKLQLQTRKWTAPPPTDYEVIQGFIQSFPVKRGVTYA